MHEHNQKSDTYFRREGTDGHTILFLTDQPYTMDAFRDVTLLLHLFLKPDTRTLGLSRNNISYTAYVLTDAQYAAVAEYLNTHRFFELNAE